jgi:Tol biopolymer transport system component
VDGVSTPLAAGETESFTVAGLAVGQEYAFALEVVDESRNRSAMSNVVTASISTFAPFQLTFNQTYYGAFNPNWSPDGSRIVFGMGVSLGPDMIRPQLHVIAAGGGQPSRYTSFTPEGAVNPLWSRDGQRFYFLKLVTVQNIYTKTVLAVMDAVPGADYTILASYGLENVGSLALSPDGSRVAYWVGNNTPGQPVSQAIYTNSSAGNDPHVLVSDIVIGGLDWSPDGTQIVYTRKEGGVYNLWVIPSSGGESTQLTTGEESKWRCAWSPDGSEIAYGSAGTIWAIPSSGGEPRRITTDSSDTDSGIVGISWSPDGTKMAYEKYVGSRYNIWITPVD